MAACGARDRDELICKRFGKEAEAARLVDGRSRGAGRRRRRAGERRARDACAWRGVLNSHEVTARVTGDPRYAAGKNSKPPRKVGSIAGAARLLVAATSACRSARTTRTSPSTRRPRRSRRGRRRRRGAARARVPGGLWTVKKPQQWANFADACNECGNCDVFCPEDGGPYVVKARYFGSRASFEASPGLDGLWIERDGSGLRVHARVGWARLLDDHAWRRGDHRRRRVARALRLAARCVRRGRGRRRRGAVRIGMSGALYLTLRTLLRGVLDPARVNAVSVRRREPARPVRTPTTGVTRAGARRTSRARA